MASIVHWGKYYPPDMGGIESVTASLARGAAAAGHEVTVVCFDKSGASAAQVLDGVRVLRAPIAMLKASQPLGWRYLWLALREGRAANLVHLHAPNMLAALVALLLPRRTRLVVHWHSDVVGKGRLGCLLQPLEAALLRRADCIVCTSPAYAEASAPLRPFASKISVVPIGVPDFAQAAATDSACEALPADLSSTLRGKRLVLSLGRLVPYKGFHVLIDAARHLPADTMTLIVGSGPLHDELQSRIDAAGLEGSVRLAGRLSDAALDKLFRSAALFCLPSVERSEAFGVVLVEAMSYGVPVVATQIPGSGVPWVTQHGISGLNVPVDDAVALASACAQILESAELRARLSCGARERFLAQFTEPLSVERTLAVYRETLAAG